MMGCNVFLLLKLLLISEFHSHCSCLSHQYHFENINLTWTDTLAYCRKYYTDLATIDNMEEMKRLTESVCTDYTGKAWIGLNKVISGRWQWSSGEGDTGYTNWNNGKPDNLDKKNHSPTIKNGINATWNFTWIESQMNWPDAQSYCRHSYTDLATVRNKEDNDLICKMFKKGTWVWIGLFQDTWEWSDQSNSSFCNWKTGQNDNVDNTCALAQVTWPGTWDMTPCDEKHPFVCYDENLILVNSNMTWNEALNYCRTHHSDLVSVHNEKIQYWVSRMAEKASTDHVWLGLRFSCSLNFWFWVSAENVCYQNWETNNSNICGNAGAVQPKDPHYWVSLPETEKLNFICTKRQAGPGTQYLQKLSKCINV
nr:C-type mannose receptor 2-like [Paramormyrops kingsleyae]